MAASNPVQPLNAGRSLRSAQDLADAGLVAEAGVAELDEVGGRYSIALPR